tara:strand:- start:387 stop:575 length:189 start_codon:yes stop_codon:yes gene_type:complete
MERQILEELKEIRKASDKMVNHIDFVERHITWVQTIIKAFTPKLSRFFSKIDHVDIPLYDVV